MHPSLQEQLLRELSRQLIQVNQHRVMFGLAMAPSAAPSFQPAGGSGCTAFDVYLSGNVGAVTGDATEYPIVYDTINIDTAAGYNTGTGLYTFPTTGVYQINVQYFVYVSSGASTSTSMIGDYFVNGSPFGRLADNSPNSLGLTTNEEFIISNSFLYNATAGDTMSIHVNLGGGTKNIGVAGGLRDVI